ncbi:unnamed protein product [Arctogadus glacialis]
MYYFRGGRNPEVGCREGYQGIRCDQFLPKTDSILADPSSCVSGHRLRLTADGVPCLPWSSRPLYVGARCWSPDPSAAPAFFLLSKGAGVQGNDDTGLWICSIQLWPYSKHIQYRERNKGPRTGIAPEKGSTRRPPGPRP